MDPILIGIVALGVAVLGLLGYGWRIFATRSVSFSILWLMVPLAGAMIAFLMTPQNLVTISLGGAAFVLTLLTLATPVVLPVILEGPTPERAESSRSESRSD